MKLALHSALQKFVGSLNPVMAIDFGSQRIRLWTADKSLDEPSLVAIDSQRQTVVAVGDAAAEISQRLAPRIKIIHPMQGGELVDLDLALELIKILTAKVLSQQFFSPTIVISLKVNATESQIQLFTDLLYKLGAKEVIGVTQPLAAAIGAGIPVADSSGGLVAVIGAGVVEIGVVALGSLVTAMTKINTLTNLAQAVIQELSNSKRVLISQETAEKLICELATIVVSGKDFNLAPVSGSSKNLTLNPVSYQNKSILVMSKSVLNGAPEEVEINAADLAPALITWLAKVDQALTELLQNLPPELTLDVVSKGLLLTGGMAQLKGLEEYLIKKLGIPVALVDEPEIAVIKGLQMVCQNLDLYKQSLAYEVRD